MNCAHSIQKLSEVLKLTSATQDADAAVAVSLKLSDQRLKVLIVKRVESPADPWSGQMALPGGKRDSKDQNLKQTVVRETLEETNINLLDRCRFLGSMETMNSTMRPELKVLPFVVFFEHEPAIRLNNELESFLWISLSELPTNKGSVQFNHDEYPAYIVRDYAIWGLTYRILKRFFRLVDNVR